MCIGKREKKWALTLGWREHPGNLYIPDMDKWGAPFLIEIKRPSFLIYNEFSVDISKNGVIHQNNVTATPQSAPDTYTVFIEEVPYPGDGIITYTIKVKFRRKTLSEDVRIIYERDS